MRFDPQANYVPADQQAAPLVGPVRAGPSLKSRLGTGAVVVGVVSAAVVGVWLWSEGATVAQPTSAEAIPVLRSTPAVVIHAEGADDALRRPNEAASRVADMEGSKPSSTDAMAGRRRITRSRRAYEAGRSCLAMGWHAEAVPQLAEATRLDPEFADAHYRLGLAYVMIGDIEAARSERAVLETLDPNLANLLGNLVR